MSNSLLWEYVWTSIKDITSQSTSDEVSWMSLTFSNIFFSCPIRRKWKIDLGYQRLSVHWRITRTPSLRHRMTQMLAQQQVGLVWALSSAFFFRAFRTSSALFCLFDLLGLLVRLELYKDFSLSYVAAVW